MNSLRLLIFDKAFVLHLNKRPHELSDLSVKERCLRKMLAEFFSCLRKLFASAVSSEVRILLNTRWKSTLIFKLS